MPGRQELEFRDFKGGGTLTHVENTGGQQSRSKRTAETKQSYPLEEINPLTGQLTIQKAATIFQTRWHWIKTSRMCQKTTHAK